MKYFSNAFSRKGNFIVYTLLFVAISLFTIISASLTPVILFLSFLSLTLLLLYLPYLGGKWERLAFFRISVLSFFFSSVGYIYYGLLGSFQGDIVHFYSNAISGSIGLSIDDIQAFTEGPLAVYIWSKLYSFVESQGLAKDYSIGLVFNAYLVSLSSIFTMKIGLAIYGNDHQRLSRLLFLFQLCGIFYLFAALHIRDAFILLTTTIFTYLVVLTSLPGSFFRRIFVFFISFPAFIYIFYYLRVESVFIPALYFSAIFISFLWIKKNNLISFSVRTLSVIIFATVFIVILSYSEFDSISSALTSLSSNSDEYIRAGQAASSFGSFGNTLILSQPPVIQFPLKLLSIFFYPIPIWHGFTVPSAYALFKSLHLLFNLFYIPLLLLSVYCLFTPLSTNNLHSSSLLLLRALLFIFLQAVIVIVLSSSESRHLAPFYPASMIVAVFPNLSQPNIRRQYYGLTKYLLCTVLLVNLAWILLTILK